MESIDTLTACIHIIPEWLELVFLYFSLGALVCILWVLGNSEDTGQDLLARIWWLLGIATAAMIACTVGDLLVRAAEMSGRPLSAAFSVLPTVVMRTHLGHVWFIRIGALVLLSIALGAGRRFSESRMSMAFMLGLLAVVSMTKSASGHASDAGDFSVAEIMDWLHLMAAAIWGGGLFVLAVAVFPELSRSVERKKVVIAEVAHRFSRLAGVAVGVMAITSLYNAWSLVGSVEALWKAPYGWVVMAKVTFLLFLISLGAFNRYVSVPLLREQAGLSKVAPDMKSRATASIARFRCPVECRTIVQQLARNIRIEALLMVLVLLCAALLRHETPARHYSHMENAGEKSSLSPRDSGSLHPHNH